ncbi:unnamed protein product [Ceutorhynchus assimilis]|uniref:Uncharacterized protein n=1 Tax=Ceutorhynchus assimilis TaxID=467358 RepID=A0A9N9QIP1_9CUCU|nr:unnamed protein product [Ceutorhynchus assimilis]
MTSFFRDVSTLLISLERLKHVFVAVSSPPTTSPKPTTTETPSRVKDWGLSDLNNSIYGNPSSLTIHLDKGAKYQSNLNEIDKSEQKSGTDNDSKGGIFSDKDSGFPVKKNNAMVKTSCNSNFPKNLCMIWALNAV